MWTEFFSTSSPIVARAEVLLKCFLIVSLKIRSFQVFRFNTRLKDSKFQEFYGEVLTEPLSRPLPTLSRASPLIRAPPSNLGRFAPSIRASPDSDLLLFICGCAPEIQHARTFGLISEILIFDHISEAIQRGNVAAFHGALAIVSVNSRAIYKDLISL